MSISPLLAAALKAGNVQTTQLVWCSFADGDEYASMTKHPVKTGNRIWGGTKGYVSLNANSEFTGLASIKREIIFSGIDEDMFMRFHDAGTKVRGRRVEIYRARFDEEWRSLMVPRVIFSGVMDLIEGSSDVGGRQLKLTCELETSIKRFAPNAFATDTDIRARTPDPVRFAIGGDDLGGQFIAPHSQRSIRGAVAI